MNGCSSEPFSKIPTLGVEIFMSENFREIKKSWNFPE